MLRDLAFITIHPHIIDEYCSFGVFKAAQAAALAKITPVPLRDYAADKHGSVDDTPYGGGDGMVMRPDCLASALDAVTTKVFGGRKPFVIYTSPAGQRWDQTIAQKFADDGKPLVFICGRFAGVDQRFIDRYVDAEYSVGDVILAGGELPSLMMAESVLRLIPGVLGHSQSANEDSFGEGMEGRLEYPSYTKPFEWLGEKVPEVLMSGNHDAIARWRRKASIERTLKLRPDLIKD